MYSYDEFIKKIKFRYDNWDDFGYKNTARLSIDDDFVYLHIHPNSPEVYTQIESGSKPLARDFFVLGEKEYYDLVNSKISEQRDREKWYKLTNDLAYSIDLLDKYLKGDCLQYDEMDNSPKDIIRRSFMRSKTYLEITNQLHRMTMGGKYLDHFQILIYRIEDNSLVFDINIDPYVDIPENTFGLIGRNGTGKTYILNNLAKLFLKEQSIFRVGEELIPPLNKVIHVSYSPFDFLDVDEEDEINFERIGFVDKVNIADSSSVFKYFNEELKKCISEMYIPSNRALRDFWLEILNNFSYEKWINVFLNQISEFYLEKEGLSPTVIANNNENWREIINSLSSGQKIIILTITKLILIVREKSLVLIDEPELFLHPSLAKSYIRAIIQIITRMNGIGVIATHSPLILQELQTNCVKITTIKNSKFTTISLNDLGINSYGENVNVLNNIVFGIDVQNTGYYQYLHSLDGAEIYDKAEILHSMLGSEGRVLLKYLLEEANETY